MVTVLRPGATSKAVRAFVYLRVSSEEQSRGYSLPTQEAACLRFAAERGYTVAEGHTFSDAYTGTESSRPGWNRLLDAIRLERPDVVLLHDIDRLGREVAVQAIAEKELERHGARIEYVLGGYDNSPSGELLKHIKGAIAQYENQQRVERSVRGKRGRVQAGYVVCPLGRAPFGYDYIAEKHKGYLVINEEQAALVRQMYHWLVVERATSYEIAKRLYLAGVPTKGDNSTVVVKKAGRAEWSPNSIRRILGNPTNKGEWYYGKRQRQKVDGKIKQVPQPPETWIKVDVPAIVDAETWEKAQECLRLNKENATRNAQHEYLLRSLIFCPCGRRWIGRVKHPKRSPEYAYYRCALTEAEYWLASCPARFSLRQERLDAAVLGYVKDCLLHPDTMTAEINRQREEQDAETAQRASRLQAVAAAVADTDRRLGELLTKELDGYPKAVIEGQKRALLDKRRDLETEQTRLLAERQQEEITPELAEALDELAETVQRGWDYMTFAERRQLLEILRLRIDVIDGDHVRVSGLITESVVVLSSACNPHKSTAIPFAAVLALSGGGER